MELYTICHGRVKRTKRLRLSPAQNARNAGAKPIRTGQGSRHATFGHRPFEAGRRKPSFDNVRALAKALKVSADYLLGAQAATTAFRDEDKLSAKDRLFIQNIIDTMIKDKK